MTEPQETALFVTDAEIARRLGIGEKAVRVMVQELERDPRFPRKDPLFSGKRYWPAFKAYLDARSGISISAPLPRDGKENFNGKARDQGRARPRMAVSS